MKLILTILLLSPGFVFSQTTEISEYSYCRIIETLPCNKDTPVTIEYSSSEKKQYPPSAVDGLNSLSSQGWEFIETYTVSYPVAREGAHVCVGFLLRKKK